MRPPPHADVARARPVLVDDDAAAQNKIECLCHIFPRRTPFTGICNSLGPARFGLPRGSGRPTYWTVRGVLQGPDPIMAELKCAHLSDRGVIRVGDEDAVKLLDGLVTNTLDKLRDSGGIYTGLLSPQGKILFDFFIVQAGGDLLIDVAREQVSALIKRLTFYRLRARVTFEDCTNTLAVATVWGADIERFPGGMLAYRDPRNRALGYRLILPVERLTEVPASVAHADDYHDHRIGVGVPEAGRDFALGDTFPHEALYDHLAGVDFKKGCFIGQEVVSRMQHRGTARKRIVPVEGDSALRGGGEVMAGDATIGKVGSTSASRGLALLRLDRAHEANEKGTPLIVDGATVTIAKPAWLRLDIATGRAEDGAA